MNKVSQRARKSVDTPWINAIPVEWSLKPIKTVLNQVSRPVGESASEITLLSLTQKGVIQRDLESGKGKFPSDFSTYQRVFPQELVFCLFDIDETPRAVGLCSAEGMVTGAYSVFQVKKDNDSKFLSHLFHWIDNEKGLRPYYTGLRKVVRPQTFGSIKIPIPELSEQTAIANFLDRETAKIDTLIAEQERLIELLQEKRQAVISHAVTKGLNPDAPMKDSGVEWLGEVPEHWIGCRFKHCLMGLTDAEHKTCPDHEEGEYLIIRTSNIREGVLITEGAKYTDANGYKEWTSRCIPQEGDIVFTREAPAGEACIIPEGVTACLGQRTVLMHPRLSKVTPEYLVSSIYSGAAKTFIQNLSQGSTVSHLNMSEIGNMPIALPPLDEQLEINKYTKEKSRKFDDLMKHARTSTKLLQERRSALISAAVTGQIDVRGLTPQEKAA